MRESSDAGIPLTLARHGSFVHHLADAKLCYDPYVSDSFRPRSQRSSKSMPVSSAVIAGILGSLAVVDSVHTKISVRVACLCLSASWIVVSRLRAATQLYDSARTSAHHLSTARAFWEAAMQMCCSTHALSLFVATYH